ncbi:MAG: class I SAM-dependent methyltransferase [Roseiflexaceae bacterium]
MTTIQDSVERQFSQVAANYAGSAVHRGGPDLAAMLAAVKLQGTEMVLDAGSGTGHTALAFAPHVREVVAYDLTEAMLAQGQRLANERGISNIRFERGDVTSLPFADASFDLVTSRYSAHHYPQPQAALAEFARVLRPQGRLLLVDVIAPDAPVSDTFLNAVELLRDPSHVRDHRIGEWVAMAEAVGLQATHAGTWMIPLEFGTWTARMQTPVPAQEQIKWLFGLAPAEARRDLCIQPDHSFSITVALIIATHAA